MFKKKILISITSLLGILSVGAFCSPVSETTFEPVLAEEESFVEEDDVDLIETEDAPELNEEGETKYASFVVNKIRKSDGKVDSKLVETYVVSQKDTNRVIKNAKKTIKKSGARGSNTYTAETTITLLRDCNFDFSDLDIGRVVIDLKGYTLTLSYRTSWDFTESLVIEGRGGSIATSRRQSGAFELLDGANNLVVRDTSFKDFNCRRYPIFQVKGNEKKNIFPNITFANCNFENCQSSTYGGVIYMLSAKVVNFTKCNFKNCKSKYGGVIYNSKQYRDDTTFENCTFENCSAKNGGVIAYVGTCKYPEDYFVPGCLTSFKNCLIKNCHATNGGLAYVDMSGLSFNFEKSPVTNCNAIKKGGAIYLEDGGVFVGGMEAVYCTADYGGGICIDAGTCRIERCSFKNCHARKKGNAVYTKGDKVTLEACSYIDCNEPGENGVKSAVFIEEQNIESVNAQSDMPIWIFGGIMLAIIIGSTLTICLVFGRKKKVE